MAHKTIEHLTVQNIPVNDLALSTLGSRLSLLLASTFGTTIKNTFLVKKIKYFLTLAGATAGQATNLLVMLAPGDVTAAEAAAALTEINTVGPQDITQVRTSDNIWNISQNTVRQFQPGGTAAEAILNDEIPTGKGIPARRNVGLQVFVFNADGTALDTGIVINGLVQLWGVWLRE